MPRFRHVSHVTLGASSLRVATGRTRLSVWADFLRGLMRDPEFRGVVRELASCFREDAFAANDGEWVDQHNSDLGPRNHCRKVTELLAEGRTDLARKVNKRRELRRDVYEAAVAERKAGQPLPPVKAADKHDKWDQRLRVVK